jgi:DNA-binding response OmpR family regulator
MAKILLVEDDASAAWAVKQTLASQNHVVDLAEDGEAALEFLKQFSYDLVIIDWHLPDTTGLNLCAEFRAMGGIASVLFLTGESGLTNKVSAFNTGADDYLCKPFEPEELVVRTRALLRRSEKEQQSMKIAHLELDVAGCVAKVNGKAVALAANEFQLLELLMRNPGRVYSSSELQDKIFGAEDDASDDAIRQRVVRLRKKIDIGGRPSLIKTIKGLGYCLREET